MLQMQWFGCASVELGLVGTGFMRSLDSPTVPCPSGGVVLACRNAIGSWEVSWTRAAAPRADERELPESGQGGARVHLPCP